MHIASNPDIKHSMHASELHPRQHVRVRQALPAPVSQDNREERQKGKCLSKPSEAAQTIVSYSHLQTLYNLRIHGYNATLCKGRMQSHPCCQNKRRPNSVSPEQMKSQVLACHRAGVEEISTARSGTVEWGIVGTV